MSWHDRSCELELQWENERPGCRKCGAWMPNVTGAAKGTSAAPPPPGAMRSNLICNWPPCVGYVNDPEWDTRTKFIRGNIDSWQVSHEPLRNESDKNDAPTVQLQEPPPTSNQLSNILPRNMYDHLSTRDSIRILHLHGATSREAPIHCSFELTHLENPDITIFEALSYTWADLDGSTELLCPIFIGPHYDVLLVTRNCSSALRQMRTCRDRRVWVDAICINQENENEKGHQVGLMGSIYSLASRVWIYLGETGSLTDLGMRLVETGESPSTREERAAAFQLTDRPYLQRIWIVQEVLLAQRASVTCGQKTVHWDKFISFLHESERAMSNVTFHGIAWALKRSPSLLQLIIDTQLCKCGDQRDRIYALLGLVSPTVASYLPIDYSLSIQQVYIGVASYLLAVAEEYRVLDFIGSTAGKTIVNLPSWVPDWSLLPKITPRVIMHIHSGTLPFWNGIDPQKIESRQPDWSQKDTLEIHSGWYLPDWTGKGNDFRHLDNGHKLQISSDASLLVTGYRLFSVSHGRYFLSCIPGLSLELLPTEEFIAADMGVMLFDEGEIHCYMVPKLKRMLMLKDHGESVYSIRGSCDIEALHPTPVPQTEVDHLTKMGMVSLEEANVERWISTLEDLWDKYPRQPTELQQDPTRMQSTNLQNLSQHLEDHFTLLFSMREGILEAMANEDMSLNFQRRFKDSDWSISNSLYKEIAGYNPEMWEIDRKIRQMDSSSVTLKALLSEWRSRISTLKKSMIQFVPICDMLNDLDGTKYELIWSSANAIERNSERKPPSSAFPSLGYGEEYSLYVIQRILELDGHDLYDNDSLSRSKIAIISTRTLTIKAMNLIKKHDLDRSQSLKWNINRFRICLATAEMIAQLKVHLRWRQILHRINSIPNHPEKIAIV